MAKWDKQRRRAILTIILLGCAGWGLLGWMLLSICRGLGIAIMALSAAFVVIAFDNHDNPRKWRWLV